MNILTLIKTELSKQRRGFIWLFVLGIPIGTTLAMFLDMYIRYEDYLYDIAQGKGITSWELLLKENHLVLGWGIFSPLFIAVIGTMIHYTEFEKKSWKKVLTLPVKRWEVYLSKYIAIVSFSFIMIALNALGLIFVGKIVGFPELIDYKLYGGYLLYQSLAILGVAALHNLLSSHLSNVVISVIVAFGGVIIAPGIVSKSPNLSKLIPYSYTYYIDVLDLSNSLVPIYGGLISMIFLTLLGIWTFNKKDIL